MAIACRCLDNRKEEIVWQGADTLRIGAESGKI